MLVFTQDTYQTFVKDTESCAHSKKLIRCIILKFSLNSQKPQNWFSIATDKINKYLGDEGMIYLFPDNDVFILSPHGTEKSLNTLLQSLPGTAMTASIYELPAQFEIILKEAALKKPKNFEPVSDPGEMKHDFISPLFDPNYAAAVQSLPARRRKRNKPEILVAEDDPFSSRLVCKTIDTRFTSLPTFDGQSTLMSYLCNAPDVIFLDIGLPDMNGLEILSDILAVDPEAYIVIISGNGSRENVLKAIAIGAKGFIAKPFTQDKIFQYIEKCPFVKAKIGRGRSIEI